MNFENAGERARFATIMRMWEINFSAKMGDNREEKIQVIRLYMRALSDFSIDQVERASKQIVLKRVYKQLPTIAEIVNEIRGKEPAIESIAQVEADKVLAATRATEWIRDENGFLKKKAPVFDDPITRHLMATRWPFQSWSMSLMEDDIKWWVKEFCTAYAAYDESDYVTKQIEAPAELKQLVENLF